MDKSDIDHFEFTAKTIRDDEILVILLSIEGFGGKGFWLFHKYVMHRNITPHCGLKVRA